MKSKVILTVVSVGLTALLAFMSSLALEMRKDMKRKDSVILSYEEKERTYYVDSIGWVTEKATFQRTIKELKRSKDSIVVKNLSLAKDLGIRTKDLVSMSNSYASLYQQFSAETVTIPYSELDSSDTALIFQDLEPMDMIEIETFSDEWTDIKRIKVVGSDSAMYEYSMNMEITEYVHKKKTKYLEKKFFLTRAIVRLFEKKREFKTVVSDNPNVQITGVHHVTVDD